MGRPDSLPQPEILDTRTKKLVGKGLPPTETEATPGLCARWKNQGRLDVGRVDG
jgi:hypothetical protein